MSVTVEWLEEPHLAQLTYQGKLTVEEIGEAWLELNDLYYQYKAQPFCVIHVILPDRQVPIGLLKLTHHAALRDLKNTAAAAVVGVDHFMISFLLESISKLPFGPAWEVFDTYDEGITYLRQVVRAQLAGL